MEESGVQEFGKAVPIIDPTEVEFGKELGEGAFGKVYSAVWRGDVVAAKKLKIEEEIIDLQTGEATGEMRSLQNVSLIKSFREEVAIQIKMRHPNIIMIMGVCFKQPDLIILTELMKRDLAGFLDSKETIDWPLKIDMSIDISRGMTYMHNMKPSMVHRDLKTNNILLDEHNRCKITDFGTVITKHNLNDKNDITGTAAYMSPERLRGEDSDETTDVYSFAIIMWEMITRKIPWEGHGNLQLVARVGHGNERPQLPSDAKAPSDFTKLMKESWEGDKKKRPSFAAVLARLRKLSSSTTNSFFV